MAETGNRRIRTDRSERPRSGSTSGGRTTARDSSPDALLELAEQIEEHGRALLARARDLRRMAEAGGEGARGRPTGTRAGGYGGNRAGESGRPQRRPSERGGSGERSRSPRSGGNSERARGNRDEVPEWAPTPRKRRS